MPTSQSQMLLLLGMVAVGFIFGALISWWATSRSKSEPERTPEPEQEIQFRQQYDELISLWRRRSSGRLVMRSGSKLFENPQTLTSTQRDSVRALAAEWLEWLGMQPHTGASTNPPAPTPAVEPRPLPPAAQREVIPMPPPPEAAASTNAPTAPLPAPRPPASTSISSKALQSAAPIPRPAPPPPVVVPPPGGKKDAKAEKPKSMVEQIDEILQENLSGTPFAEQEIRLVEDPARGVIVWVGLNHYNGIEAVPDAEIKAILRESAAEWERRMTLGKKK